MTAEFVHEQQSLFEQDFTAVFGDLCGKCQIVADVLFQSPKLVSTTRLCCGCRPFY